MFYRIAADVVLVTHFLFIVFVVLGGLLVMRYRRIVWIHVPAAVWGVGIELVGAVCPLTTVENWLRRSAGDSGYAGGFVEHYIVPLIYPSGLTRSLQFWLAGVALSINLLIYGLIYYRHRRSRGRR